MGELQLTATQDGAGDGWIDLWIGAGAAPFVGFHARSLRACNVAGLCEPVVVFGGTGGAAEVSRLHVAAGYAFVHGVFGACPSRDCPAIHVPASSGDPPVLLTTLSVALPKQGRIGALGRVCLDEGWVHPADGRAAASVTHGPVCTPLQLTRGLGPPALPNGTIGRRGGTRGVAMVKTYKTGSSTLGALLHRYADARGFDVAVNAKAIRGPPALRRHLGPGTMPKPTECLFEFHTFKACGEQWVGAQRASAAVKSGGLAPKPLQLVIDHSRWQPLDELLPKGRRRSSRAVASVERPASTRLEAPLRACALYLERMRAASGAAHTLFLGGSASDAAAELCACVDQLAERQRQSAGVSAHGGADLASAGVSAHGGADLASAGVSAHGGADLAAPSAYREAIPGSVLLTIMRWPAARFTSALEQFWIPQQTGVPCSRISSSGGRCHGQTCERDFKFTWTCMNQSVDRFGMLAATMRCLVDRVDASERATRRLADLSAIGSRPPPSEAAREALEGLRAQLLSTQRRYGASGIGRRLRRRNFGGGGGNMGAAPPATCDLSPGLDDQGKVIPPRKKTREVPDSFRFVKEAVANTLGWPLLPMPHANNWRRMLNGGGGGSTGDGGRSDGAGGGSAGGSSPGLALEWLASLARSLDHVMISEHFDESLLVLGRILDVPAHELIYISQKRRVEDKGAKAGRAATKAAKRKAPAALAAGSPAALGSSTAWPSEVMLRDPEGPWLWPSDLDGVLRANWLDSLAYMYFNATLWKRIGEFWPGEAGANLQAELASFRRTRAAVLTGCRACEQLGAAACLEAARASPAQVPPHFCWSLRQDTKSWSEHFFKRMALRFDAAAAVRTPATGGGKGEGTGGGTGEGSSPSAGGDDADHAGVKTGNVRWWRCPATRAVSAHCSQLRREIYAYSLWDCACQW